MSHKPLMIPYAHCILFLSAYARIHTTSEVERLSAQSRIFGRFLFLLKGSNMNMCRAGS